MAHKEINHEDVFTGFIAYLNNLYPDEAVRKQLFEDIEKGSGHEVIEGMMLVWVHQWYKTGYTDPDLESLLEFVTLMNEYKG